MSTNVRQLFDLTGRTALVTGGSRGLGLQMAVALLSQKGIDARWVAADASDPAKAHKVCAETLERMGPVDILVNNAGAAWGAPAEEHPLEAWDKVMNLNIRSLFVFSQAIGRLCMIPRRHGRIINLASIAGLGGNPAGMETIAYNTSKGAVVNFTRALAAEWGEHGITVNAIAPGFFPSKMTRGTLERVGEETLAAHAPLRRLGDDDDLKGATLLFASQAGKHITGQVLAVDGGVSCVTGG